VTGTLRDLMIGLGLEFDDRGVYRLKGVPGERRLFAVESSWGKAKTHVPQYNSLLPLFDGTE
jgi:hypothetical protein